MQKDGKRNILGVLIDAVDNKGAEQAILRAAHERRAFSVSALAVHGVMTGVLNRKHRYRLNHFDLLVPDGQPVRWAMNWLYGAGLRERVYGPNLTLAVCERAEKENLSVYFYGSTPAVLSQLEQSLSHKFPRLVVAGAESSKFRQISREEKAQVVQNIHTSGASIVFLGLGCPRQEVWAYEFRDSLSIPVLAVGAAFPFLAGVIPQAPRWMQDRGLEWLFRLAAEPRRLWRRYLLLNPAYLMLVALQAARILRFGGRGRPPAEEMLFG